MAQSSTLYVGMDVHKESIAVAYVAQAYGAEVVAIARALSACMWAIAKQVPVPPAGYSWLCILRPKL
jgi:hypothetical protein